MREVTCNTPKHTTSGMHTIGGSSRASSAEWMPALVARRAVAVRRAVTWRCG